MLYQGNKVPRESDLYRLLCNVLMSFLRFLQMYLVTFTALVLYIHLSSVVQNYTVKRFKRTGAFKNTNTRVCA